ncbi:MAG: YgiT-type zinc finger protein [Anaerolineales bacterium]|jgi:YgiT-type zinc finger domain-containing protein
MDSAQQGHEAREEKYTCPECQAGVLHLRHLTYFTQMEGELITVPNFPAWVCDMCGYREDDSRAENLLHILLNPRTGRRPLRRPRTTGRPGPKSTRDRAS